MIHLESAGERRSGAKPAPGAAFRRIRGPPGAYEPRFQRPAGRPALGQTSGGADVKMAEYTYGTYVDEVLTMDRKLGGTGPFQRLYFHTNRMFSTHALTDSLGTVVERYSYTAYGLVTTFDGAYGAPQSSSRVGNPFTFTGRELDPETGLMHYRARTYDPAEGRFKQRAPVGYVDGMALYEYVRSGPTAFVDLLGKMRPQSMVALVLASIRGLLRVRPKTVTVVAPGGSR
jgi:RHS repeat-associated protein